MASLPPGFRFHPTDEELVGYYLKRKVEGLEIELEVIPVIDLYKFDPWELPEKSFLPNRDMEWFFFCPRDRKYPNGSRTNRATKAGYWKATGKDRKVVCQSSVTGCRKTLVFYQGRAPMGERTEWVMHEYRLCDDLSQGPPNFKGAFALCRVIKKNEITQKASDVHGEPRAKQVGSSSNEPMVISEDTAVQTSHTSNGSNFSSPIASPYQTRSVVENEAFSMGTNPSSPWVPPDLILDSSKEYSQGVSGYSPRYEFPNSLPQWPTYSQYEISPSSSYSNFTEEVEQNYKGFYGNGDVQYEGFEAPICRQSSGDGCLVELGSLVTGRL